MLAPNDNNNNNNNNNVVVSKDELVQLLQLIPHPEGGYFRETWRSGVAPMQSRGQTDLNITNDNGSHRRHVVVTQRRSNRPNGDDDGRRNALTSIFWVPTIQSPKLLLAVNESDHVHYYQGGRPFEYFLYEPTTTTTTTTAAAESNAESSSSNNSLTRVILGPNLREGHQLQVCVAGGTWKCGRILQEKTTDNGGDDTQQQQQAEYTIIGEAVGPGFDFYDFAWITLEQIEQQSHRLDVTARQFLQEFCHPMNQSSTMNEIDAHYNDDTTSTTTTT